MKLSYSIYNFNLRLYKRAKVSRTLTNNHLYWAHKRRLLVWDAKAAHWSSFSISGCEVNGLPILCLKSEVSVCVMVSDCRAWLQAQISLCSVVRKEQHLQNELQAVEHDTAYSQTFVCKSKLILMRWKGLVQTCSLSLVWCNVCSYPSEFAQTVCYVSLLMVFCTHDPLRWDAMICGKAAIVIHPYIYHLFFMCWNNDRSN